MKFQINKFHHGIVSKRYLFLLSWREKCRGVFIRTPVGILVPTYSHLHRGYGIYVGDHWLVIGVIFWREWAEPIGMLSLKSGKAFFYPPARR